MQNNTMQYKTIPDNTNNTIQDTTGQAMTRQYKPIQSNTNTRQADTRKYNTIQGKNTTHNTLQ